jgi:hypothetical protein
LVYISLVLGVVCAKRRLFSEKRLAFNRAWR